MEFKADALVLRAVDYGENDKIVTLLTAERGKLGAGLKGVKKAGAKLKFASQPFCFAEFVFAERAGRRTVTQAFLHEGFFSLREDIISYYCGAAVLGACDLFSYEGMECGELLVSAVSALERMEGERAPAALLAFLLRALRFAGYPVHAGDCPVCGRPIAGRRYFDLAGGSFNCAGCAVGVPASESTYLAVRAAERGEDAPPDGVKRALRLLSAYIGRQTDAELSALKEVTELI